MKIEINATQRTQQGTGASRRLRRAERVPAILYGGTDAPEMIELDHNELFHKLKLEAFHSSILSMKFGERQQQVLLRDYQMHPFRQIVLHADFQRVAADQKLHMRVPLHFVHADIAPGVKQSGGIVSHTMNDVEVLCLPADLPEFIEVDLSNLTAAHSLHLSDVVRPNGVEFSAVVKGDNPVVATIVVPRGATAEEEAEAAPAAAAEVPATKQPAKPAAKEAAKPAGKDDKKK